MKSTPSCRPSAGKLVHETRRKHPATPSPWKNRGQFDHSAPGTAVWRHGIIRNVQALEALIHSTIQLGLSAPSGSPTAHSYPQQLAATELGEMALSMKSILAVAAVGLVSLGLGFYGLSGRAIGQESPATETITVQEITEPPAPTYVNVAAAQDAFGTQDPQTASNAAPGSTSPRLEAFQRISKALNDEVILEFNESPLSEVVDFLKNTKEIPIIIDRPGLEEIGMGSDTPITVSFAGISLRSGLARMLGELGLDYVVQNEMLVITSREAARNQPDPRIYKIDGLHITEDTLIELITSMVAPETWDEVGGTGRIKSLGGDSPCLVIAQTDQVHDQIADFLEKLRQAHVAR